MIPRDTLTAAIAGIVLSIGGVLALVWWRNREDET